MRNQCDGCSIGAPVNAMGHHYNPRTKLAFMSCTAHLYSAPAPSTEPTADKARRSQNLVHNHGPEEGKGLGCKETLVDGKLRGECLDWYGDQLP